MFTETMSSSFQNFVSYTYSDNTTGGSTYTDTRLRTPVTTTPHWGEPAHWEPHPWKINPDDLNPHPWDIGPPPIQPWQPYPAPVPQPTPAPQPVREPPAREEPKPEPKRQSPPPTKKPKEPEKRGDAIQPLPL